MREFTHNSSEGIIVEITKVSSFAFVVATLYVHRGNKFPKSFLDAFIKAAGTKPAILAGDFNAASHKFGSRTNTLEGDHLAEIISDNGLLYLENSSPTFFSSASGSWNILDMAFANDRFMERIVNFEVEEEYQSDNKSINRSLSSESAPKN